MKDRNNGPRFGPQEVAGGETPGQILKRRLGRRSLLKAGTLGMPLLAPFPGRADSDADTTLGFAPIAGSTEDEVRVPEGYTWEILVRWGERLGTRAPRFDPEDLDPAAQRQQVGYNCGFLGWVDYRPTLGGIVCLGHGDTNPELMFPDYSPERTTLEQVNYELAALGATLFQAPPSRGQDAPRYWFYRTSNYNERLHGESTLPITGPVAGHPLLVTSTDPSGALASGTFSACGGGTTPWRTFLVAEGCFGRYFANNASVTHELAHQANSALGVEDVGSTRPWWQFHHRFDLKHEPNEINKFGWVVEVDPWDREWPRRKLTALGRMSHCSASVAVASSKRLAVYTADTSDFGHVYKFVSTEAFNRMNRPEARKLLEDGVLHVARFSEDGTGEWLPLLYETGPLNVTNGFASQADVLLFPGRAAELLNATRVQGPVDIQASGSAGKAYLSLRGTDPLPPTTESPATNPGGEGSPPNAETPRQNSTPTPAQPVSLGQIVEIEEDAGDSGGTTFTWRIFIECGDPQVEQHGTFFAGFDPGRASALARPGQIRLDTQGNLAICTRGQAATLGIHDGVFLVPTSGSERGFNRQFLSTGTGAACGGVLISPNQEVMMVSILHPGGGGSRGERITTFGGGQIDRPAIVAVTRTESPYGVGS